MTSPPPDTGRAAVYAAEAAAFEGTDLEHVVGIGAVTQVIGRVAATEWWPGPRVVAVSARADAHSSSARTSVGSDGGATIRIAAPQATLATAAHELAHALAGIERGHDELYRRAAIDVVTVMTNLTMATRRRGLHGDQLVDAYAAFGLEVGERSWPTPSGFGEAIAL